MNEAEMARTESAFREWNEAIAETATRLDADEVDFVCECADPNCANRLTVTLDTYESVRAEPTHFIIAPGHEESPIERVLEHRRGYAIVEKVGATVTRIVRSLYPRRPRDRPA
jgi:uncharacterized protein (DUF1499 family)